jgi:RNA polymerase sigma factor (sigma-70 family)
VSHIGNQTNVVLLGWTQEYLRALLAKEAADSVITLAWDEFYRIYDALLRRFAAAQGLRGSDIDDCLQEVWMEIASRLVNFERPELRSGLRAWLYTLVRSKSCDLLKRKRRLSTENLDTARAGGIEPIANSADPADSIDRQWKRALLQTVMQEVREEVSNTNWRLLQMRFVEGADIAEIAEELGISPEQVRYRQRRLVKKLRLRAKALTGENLSED